MIDNKLGEIALEILDFAISVSHDVCLIVGIIGLIFAVCGWKKGQTIAILSPVVYLIIKIIGGAILGV